MTDAYRKLFSGEPLDDTQLAKDIAESVPEANQQVRLDAWRADFKRRVRVRRIVDAALAEIAEMRREIEQDSES